MVHFTTTVKPVLGGHSKRTPKIVFQYQLLLNAGQKYCRMLQGEYSAILLTFINLSFSIKTFVLFIFKWPLETGFTVIVIKVVLERQIVLTLTRLLIQSNLGLHCLPSPIYPKI